MRKYRQKTSHNAREKGERPRDLFFFNRYSHFKIEDGGGGGAPSERRSGRSGGAALRSVATLRRSFARRAPARLCARRVSVRRSVVRRSSLGALFPARLRPAAVARRRAALPLSLSPLSDLRAPLFPGVPPSLASSAPRPLSSPPLRSDRSSAPRVRLPRRHPLF